MTRSLSKLATVDCNLQVLKEFSTKRQLQQPTGGGGSGKKSKQPMTLNIADMIDALEVNSMRKVLLIFGGIIVLFVWLLMPSVVYFK